MSKKNIAVIALVVAAVLIGGSLFASNMGFKLNRVLNKGGSSVTLPDGSSNTSASGINPVALPYFNPYGDSLVALTDLNEAFDGNSATREFSQFGEWDQANDAIAWYTGIGSGGFFTVAGEKGYFAQMDPSSPSNQISWIIVGSHDPGRTTPLTQTGTSINAWSYPYHSTLSNALDLCNEARAAATVAADVFQVGFWNESTDSISNYVCGQAGTGFSLSPGEPYFIQLDATASGPVNLWVPSHY